MFDFVEDIFPNHSPYQHFANHWLEPTLAHPFGDQIPTRRDRDPKQWQQDLNLHYPRVPFLPVESSGAISAAKSLATATRGLPWDQRSPG